MQTALQKEVLEQLSDTEADETIIVITEKISSEEITSYLDKIRNHRSQLKNIKIRDTNFSLEFLLFMDQYLTNLEERSRNSRKNLDQTDLVYLIKPNEENHHQYYSRSASYRLREASHLNQAGSYIENLLTNTELEKFKDLWETAEDEEKCRVYDLANEPKDELNKHYAEFAIKQNPANLVEFVETYQFFKAWSLNLKTEIEKVFNKNSSLTKKEKKAKTKEEHEKLLEEGQEKCEKIMKNYFDAARTFEVGPLECSIQTDGEELRNLSAKLNFKSKNAFAYHVLKHKDEVPSEFKSDISLHNTLKAKMREELIDIVESMEKYLKAARAVIEKGTVECTPNQFGGYTFKYECESIGLKTYVKLNNNEAVIATCFAMR